MRRVYQPSPDETTPDHYACTPVGSIVIGRHPCRSNAYVCCTCVALRVCAAYRTVPLSGCAASSAACMQLQDLQHLCTLSHWTCMVATSYRVASDPTGPALCKLSSIRAMEARSQDVIGSLKSFRDLHIEPGLCDALQKAGYSSPSPVQEAALPHVLAGTDVLVQAKSGTGKTLLIACAALRHCRKDGGQRPQVPPGALAVGLPALTHTLQWRYRLPIACASACMLL